MSRRNQQPKGPPEGLTREEGRYLDGEASPEESRRMEHLLAADPARAGRLEAWQQAMDLWREDAQHAAASLHACSLSGQEGAVSEDGAAFEDLADRILQGDGLREDGLRRDAAALTPRLRAAPWYAAAAALLMTIGVTGTLIARAGTPATASAPHLDSPPQLGSLDDGVVEVMIDGPELQPGLAATKEGR